MRDISQMEGLGPNHVMGSVQQMFYRTYFMLGTCWLIDFAIPLYELMNSLSIYNQDLIICIPIFYELFCGTINFCLRIWVCCFEAGSADGCCGSGASTTLRGICGLRIRTNHPQIQLQELRSRSAEGCLPTCRMKWNQLNVIARRSPPQTKI